MFDDNIMSNKIVYSFLLNDPSLGHINITTDPPATTQQAAPGVTLSGYTVVYQKL
jgi:hypothetical protein